VSSSAYNILLRYRAVLLCKLIILYVAGFREAACDIRHRIFLSCDGI
jgi:hypothetical protein